MMNSPFVREMALAVGAQFADANLADEESSYEEVVERLYQRILIRKADDSDIALGKTYITRLMNDGKSQQEAIASFVQILFSSTEFRFIE